MTPPRAARLTVTADLRLDVDGVVAELTGHGDRLLVRTDHPVRLARSGVRFARAVSTGDSDADPVRAVLSRLDDEGLTVTVAGPRGELMHLGATAGSRHVSLAAPVLRRGLLAAGLVVATAITTRMRRRRSDG